MKILVVDDENAIRQSLNLLLSDEGYHVDSAPGVEEAMKLLVQQTYDLVITDLLMPKFDGLELVKTIRQKWGKQLPIIIITAHGTTDIASMALNEGISDFIMKPFEIKTISDAVRYTLEKQAHRHSETEAPPWEHHHRSDSNIDFEKNFFGLSQMDELGKAVTMTGEIDKIGHALLDMIQNLLQPDRSLLVVYRRDRYEIKFEAIRSRIPGEDKITAMDKVILEWITRGRQALVIEDTARDPRFRACLAGYFNSGALLAVPFLHRNFAVGGLVLYRKAENGAFHPEAVSFLSVLANLASIAIENAELYDELKNYFTGTIRALISTVEIKDPLNYGHSARVARYALMLGKQLQIGEIELRRLEYLALLHDIGKIGIPEKILRQQPELTPEEMEIFKNHVILGENIVRSIHFLPGGDKIVRAHHEMFDGQGYPDNLKGETIPLFARIITIADAVDSIPGRGVPRDMIDQPRTLERLRAGAGGRFDPALVELFVKAYQEVLQV